MKHITFLIIFFLLMIESYSSAAIDDLEDIGSNCAPVTIRVIDGVTVTISTQGGYPITARTYYDSTCLAFLGANDEPNAPLNPGNVSGTRFISSYLDSLIGFPQAQPVIFQFDQPVTFFGLTTIDLCENQDPVADLKLQAFDYSDVLIDEHVRSGPQGPSGLDLDWSVSGSGIVKVLLTGTISLDAPGYGIDDLILIVSSGNGIEFQETIKPTHITLHQNYPNPFNPQTIIKYELPSQAHVTLNIFDVNGRLVHKIIDEVKTKGSHSKTWDGVTNTGEKVSSGVYFYQLMIKDADSGLEMIYTKKMVLIK